MASLLAEHYGNLIKTEGALKINSNFKKLLDPFILQATKTQNTIFSTKANYFFEELETDKVNHVLFSYENEELLKANGYNITTEEKYPSESFNYIMAVEEIPFIKDPENNFVEKINMNLPGENSKTLEFYCEGNFVIFFSEAMGIEYFYHSDENIIFLDFKIDKKGFIYIIYKKTDLEKTFYAVTSTGLNFLKMNFDNEINPNEVGSFGLNPLNENLLLSNIEVENGLEVIEQAEPHRFICSKKDGSCISYKLGKKYYFLKERSIFFNITEGSEVLKNSFLSERNLQVEHLNMYNYLNVLGLNGYKTDGVDKISTNENWFFKNIFKNKFDNTLNGGLNFFNGKKIKTLNGESFYELKKKDYLINISDEWFDINGNFVHKYLKGDFKIELQVIDGGYVICSLYEKSTFLKRVKSKIDETNSVYFCNLKITLKKFSYSKNIFSYEVECHDKYTFFEVSSKDSVNSIPNLKEISRDTSLTKNTLGYEEKIIKPTFDGKSIKISNYFNYSSSAWFFSSRVKKLKRNEHFNINGKKWFTFGKFRTKGERVYALEDLEVIYSESENVSFELINKVGTITKFWQDNEGEKMYFGIIDNKTVVKKHFFEGYSFSFVMPKINSILEIKNKEYDEVEIIDNDMLEVNVANKEETLITDKFLEVPLFKKLYLNYTPEKFFLYDGEGGNITSYIMENFKQGVVVYFNSDSEVCRYTTSIEENQHFKPIDVKKNYELEYKFNMNSEVLFKKEETFGVLELHCDNFKSTEEVSLFIYKKNRSVLKVTYTKQDLSRGIELNEEISMLKVETKYPETIKELKIKNIYLKSITSGKVLTFKKEKFEDLVYVSKKNNSDKLSDVSFNKLNINYTYEIRNGILKEKAGGNVFLNPLCPSSIFFEEVNNFRGFEVSKVVKYSHDTDEFYNNNFKAPGVFYKSFDGDFDKFAESENNTFTSLDIT